ncbi:MAG: hypothetical protein ABJB76_07240 [Candidatus Nitrosocosmicus sp.]
MISNKMIALAILTISAATGIYGINMASYSFAVDPGEIAIVGGMCPEGHECICTPQSGVLHDITAQQSVNMGCDGREGANGGQ